MQYIPSVSGLRAFEAAGRSLSFVHAARELNVTPGAISRQIQSLEAYLGAALFTRSHKRVELTPQGRDYLADIAAPLAARTSKALAPMDRVSPTVPGKVSVASTDVAVSPFT